MLKNPLRTLFVLFALIATLVVTTLPAGAQTLPLSQATQTPMSGTLHQGASPQCAHLKVNLQGTKPATWNCLDKKDSQGHVIPFTYVSDCSSETLIIYADINESGWTICFFNTGFVNMTDFCGPAPYGCLWNWNDQASSYQSNCAAGSFYADINTQGTRQIYPDHFQENFDGSTPLHNDTLSSLTIVSMSC